MKKSKRKSSKSQKVRELLAKGVPVKDIVKRTGVTAALVYNIRSKQNKEREVFSQVLADIVNVRPPAREFSSDEEGISDAELEYQLNKNPGELLETTIARLNPDMVNHPPHYNMGKIPVIDFIEDQKLSYHLGNVVAYVCRANHKGSRLEDLKKAVWYLNRAIERNT